jgi:hypothetical protein
VTDRPDSELRPGHAAFRFLIELAALSCWALVGWHLADGAARWALAIALPLVAGVVWATFRTPGDHSAGGGAPVAVPGTVRLLIELDVLLGAAIAVGFVRSRTLGVALAAAVVVHYATTLARIRWLLRQRT